MRRIWFLILLISFPLNAQTPVAVLLPLLPASNVPGALGSLWTTQVMVENSSDHDIAIVASPCNVCSPPPPYVTVPPQSTVPFDSLPLLGGGIGGYAFIDASDAPFLRMHLRVRDMSRQAETYGTEIPVVPQSDFLPVIRLIDVPTDPRFRVTLRMYASIFGSDSATVTVLPQNGTTPLRTIPVTLVNGVAQLDPVAGLTDPSVRIVVASSTPIWAFASVTNNATQDVTTVTPMRLPADTGEAGYLLPILPSQNIAGVNGSSWSTDFAAENSSDHDITLDHYSCIVCGVPPPPGSPVFVPRQTTVIDPPVTPNIAMGADLFALREEIPFVRLHLRVRDMSREAESFGTEIPVVPQTAFRQSIRLIDVPTDPRFRLNLRVYSDRGDVHARVTVLPPNGTTPLASQVLSLQNAATHLDPLQSITTADPSVRVVVDSVEGEPLWAFISVTNNTTQDVTTITESP